MEEEDLGDPSGLTESILSIFGYIDGWKDLN